MYIQYDKVAEDRAVIKSRFFVDTAVPKELLPQLTQVAFIPTAEEVPGKYAEYYYNPKTGAIWYEYREIPMAEKDEIKQLKAEIEALKLVIDDIILNGGTL